ncbi:hypothetical protein HWV62_20322 [Athelia sp. TMB]|nr:hypothetical protein HWV62_20322 [Athelia sp. TMB]
MIHTRSRSTAQPPGKNNSQPHPKPPPNQKQETRSKPKAKPKLTPKTLAQDIETAVSEESEAFAPVKNSKKRKASQTPAPTTETELGNSDRTQPEPVSKHRNILTMPPRDPLPDRGTNRQDIGGPDRPRYKCTTAQVQEDMNRREQVQQKLDDLEAAKLRLLAEMEIQQEREDAEEEALAVRGFEDELLDENNTDSHSWTRQCRCC